MIEWIRSKGNLIKPPQEELLSVESQRVSYVKEFPTPFVAGLNPIFSRAQPDLNKQRIRSNVILLGLYNKLYVPISLTLKKFIISWEWFYDKKCFSGSYFFIYARGVFKRVTSFPHEGWLCKGLIKGKLVEKFVVWTHEPLNTWPWY